MYIYFIGLIVIVFTLYYFNYNPLTIKNEPVDTSEIENSINELKSLNEYIDNGPTHRATLP